MVNKNKVINSLNKLKEIDAPLRKNISFSSIDTKKVLETIKTDINTSKKLTTGLLGVGAVGTIATSLLMRNHGKEKTTK